MLYSSACSFHIAFVSVSISCCIRQLVHFILYSSAFFIWYRIRQHFSFYIEFASMSISHCTRQHVPSGFDAFFRNSAWRKIWVSYILIPCSLLWITLTVESFILRLSCKKEADFSISHKNYALTGSVIGKYTVPHLGKCVEECMANHGCKSMNYKASGGENNCELNSKIRQNSKADQYAERPGWMYISTDYSKFKVISFYLLVTSNLSVKNPSKPQ